jgi:hypothetical protein
MNGIQGELGRHHDCSWSDNEDEGILEQVNEWIISFQASAAAGGWTRPLSAPEKRTASRASLIFFEKSVEDHHG